MKLPKPEYFRSYDEDPMEKRLQEITYSESKLKRKGKIALIIPPSPQIPTPGREFLVTGPFEGFTYIGTLIKKMGYELKILDGRLKDNVIDFIIEGIQDVDIIGIATFCDSYTPIKKITSVIKENYSEKLIFLGGPLISSLPEIILENTEADCAILGEAELTLIEFLENYFSNKRNDFIKGMAYKKEGKVIRTDPRPQIKNLDNLPLLNYTIWPNYENIVKNGQILISSMRGCTQECSFCFKTIPLLRLKSLERFEQEVAYLKKATGFDYTWLNDLTFNVIKKRASKVADILRRYNVKYHCFARVRNISKEFVKKLKNTGCLGIWFGIESYDQEILDFNRKNIRIEDIDNAVKIASEAGLAVRGLFIVGLYKENVKSLEKMVDFIKNSKFLPLVKYLVPFPGTSLYQYALKKNMIKDPVAFLELLSKRRVRDYDDDIINITDLDEEILRDYFHKIWNITKERKEKFKEYENSIK